jgi:hypothetical protein
MTKWNLVTEIKKKFIRWPENPIYCETGKPSELYDMVHRKFCFGRNQKEFVAFMTAPTRGHETINRRHYF